MSGNATVPGGMCREIGNMSITNPSMHVLLMGVREDRGSIKWRMHQTTLDASWIAATVLILEKDRVIFLVLTFS